MKFLAVADMHCSEKEQTGTRLHALSLGKLRKALERSAGGCDFIMNLGDTAQADRGYRPQEELFSLALAELDRAGLPFYSVIGNHDTATEKQKVTELLQMPGRYYRFDSGSYRCLVLDASLNAPDKPYPKTEIKWDECYIDNEQGSWLRKELAMADRPVLVFSHLNFVLKPGWVEDLHLIVNREEYMRLFADSGKVAAVFSGHYHPGDVEMASGIPYVTFAAMCEGLENTYALVTVEGSTVRVDGFGTQPSYKIEDGNLQ